MIVTVDVGNPYENVTLAERLELSPREREVLALVAQGASTAVIGEALFISRHTADTHIKHIYRKLGVKSRAAAVSQGVRLALIEI